MIFSILLILVVLATVSAVAFLVVRQQSMLGIANEDAAFEGSIDYKMLTPKRVAELKPLVDRVGVISRGITERRQGNYQEVVEAFDIFVIDIEGAIHDVTTVEDLAEAARIARSLGQQFDIPLDDPGEILRGKL